TLAIPDQRIFCRLLAIASNHVILGLIIKQFSLAFVLDYDQAERLVRFIHVVRGFGYGAVSIVFPVRSGNSLNGLEGRCIEPTANGKGFARFFTVVEDIRLITR